MNVPNAKEVGRFQHLISKNPTAFVAVVFFMMFGLTYIINIRKNDDAEEYWKELYIKEKQEKDQLKDQLLYKAGVIEQQNQLIKQADSTLRQKTEVQANYLIKKIR